MGAVEHIHPVIMLALKCRFPDKSLANGQFQSPMLFDFLCKRADYSSSLINVVSASVESVLHRIQIKQTAAFFAEHEPSKWNSLQDVDKSFSSWQLGLLAWNFKHFYHSILFSWERNNSSISLPEGQYLWCTGWVGKKWSKPVNVPSIAHQMSHWAVGGRGLTFFKILDLITLNQNWNFSWGTLTLQKLRCVAEVYHFVKYFKTQETCPQVPTTFQLLQLVLIRQKLLS